MGQDEARAAGIPWYTEAEFAAIEGLRREGKLSLTCPEGHFWMRDYGYPIRRCLLCGVWKPWADREQIDESY